MKHHILRGGSVFVCLLAAAVAALGQAPSGALSASRKIALIDMNTAISRTQEGQQRAKELEVKFAPTSTRSTRIKEKQQKIADLRNQLSRGRNTMSDDARLKLRREIQSTERDLKRATEDAQAEFTREEGKVLNEIGNKLLATITKYSIDKGLSLVLNVSALPNLSIVFALNELNITEDIIKLYDQEHPVPGSSSSAPAAAPSSP